MNLNGQYATVVRKPTPTEKEGSTATEGDLIAWKRENDPIFQKISKAKESKLWEELTPEEQAKFQEQEAEKDAAAAAKAAADAAA